MALMQLFCGICSDCESEKESNNHNIDGFPNTENSVESKTLYSLGYTHQEYGNIDLALDLYKKCILFTPNHEQAHYHMGVIYQNRNQAVEACQCFEKVIQINPNNFLAYYNVGYIKHCEGDPVNAIMFLTAAAKLNPGDLDTWINLALAYHDADDLESSVRANKQALSIEESDMAYYNLANTLHDMRMVDGAIESYTMAIKLNSNHTDALFNLGIAYQETGQLEEALKCYVKVRSIDPSLTEVGSAIEALTRYLKSCRKEEKTEMGGLNLQKHSYTRSH